MSLLAGLKSHMAQASYSLRISYDSLIIVIYIMSAYIGDSIYWKSHWSTVSRVPRASYDLFMTLVRILRSPSGSIDLYDALPNARAPPVIGLGLCTI